MIFAVSGLVIEREPMQWADFGNGLILWLQNAGAIAALGLALFLLAQVLRGQRPFAPILDAYPGGRGRFLTLAALLLAVLSFVGYAVIGLIALGSLSGGALANWMPRAGQPGLPLSPGDYVLAAAGLCALLVVLTPVLLSLFRLRAGRVWALARLSLKEAVRNRIVLVFAFMALVFLFADWFVPYKPEDQVRNYVRVVYWSMAPLFLIVAGLLGAFSIPNDIKNQSIHTIVTKPVEKFEIVLGRFLGYGILLTAGLAGVSLLSLVYVVRGVNEDAARESYKARVPVFGDLTFLGTKRIDRGESVGREFEYRSYIGGPQANQPNAPRQYAVWTFPELPTSLARREEPVKVEFTFDIFRLSKGEENKGVYTTFTFIPGHVQAHELNQLKEKLEQQRERLQSEARAQLARDLSAAKDPQAREKLNEAYLARLADIQNELVRRFGVYEAAGVEVTDYHTQTLLVPAVFFQALAEAEQKAGPDGQPVPDLRVLVSVDRARETQMLGVARRDLYLLAAELPFWQNFLKGTVGMWCTSMLVLGVAVACSTYLSGIISWLLTMFLFVTGMFNDYLAKLAENRVEGGGPTEAMFRLASGKQINAPLDASPTVSVLQGADQFFSWWLRRFLNLVPDVNRFDLHQYVANGFDIAWTQVLLLDNLVPLVGYLLPWAVLAFYLMKYREVANPG